MTMKFACRTYHSSPVLCIGPDRDLSEAYSKMEENDVSSLAVTCEQGKLLGVLTRTDLLRIGQRQAGSAYDASLLTLPNKPVKEMMSTLPGKVGPDQSAQDAAKMMVEHRWHRIYVVDELERPVGVLSTRDLMLAVRDKRLKHSVEEYMSSPVFTIRHHEPVSEAVHRLEKAHVSGLVVMEESWPVGVFTQRDALLFQTVARSTMVEEVMNPAIVILPPDTPMYRAAAQAAALRVRRVLISDGKEVVGILTGLDFARAACQ